MAQPLIITKPFEVKA